MVSKFLKELEDFEAYMKSLTLVKWDQYAPNFVTTVGGIPVRIGPPKASGIDHYCGNTTRFEDLDPHCGKRSFQCAVEHPGRLQIAIDGDRVAGNNAPHVRPLMFLADCQPIAGFWHPSLTLRPWAHSGKGLISLT